MTIVDCLQKKKHICGFMGDGTNDGLALRKADVGICVESGKISSSIKGFPFIQDQPVQTAEVPPDCLFQSLWIVK